MLFRSEEAAALEERRLQDETERREAEREKKIAPEVAALQRIGERPAGLTNIAAPFNAPPRRLLPVRQPWP